MPVRLLRGFEVAQHAQGVDWGFARDQRTGGFHQIARPHQVIAAKIFVAFVEPPWNGEAGDDAAHKIFGFVSAQHGHAGAVEIMLAPGLIEREEDVLPVAPLAHEVIADLVGIFEQ